MAYNRKDSTHKNNKVSPYPRAREKLWGGCLQCGVTSDLQGMLWSHARPSILSSPLSEPGAKRTGAKPLLLGRSGSRMFALTCCIHWHTDSTQLSKYQPSRQILSTTKTFSRIMILQVFFFLWQNHSFKKSIYNMQE